jgi:hypothetical protein
MCAECQADDGALAKLRQASEFAGQCALCLASPVRAIIP